MSDEKTELTFQDSGAIQMATSQAIMTANAARMSKNANKKDENLRRLPKALADQPESVKNLYRELTKKDKKTFADLVKGEHIPLTKEGMTHVLEKFVATKSPAQLGNNSTDEERLKNDMLYQMLESLARAVGVPEEDLQKIRRGEDPHPEELKDTEQQLSANKEQDKIEVKHAEAKIRDDYNNSDILKEISQDDTLKKHTKRIEDAMDKAPEKVGKEINALERTFDNRKYSNEKRNDIREALMQKSPKVREAYALHPPAGLSK
ncbi:MAG: hypothetical protein LBM38_01105 [Clostridiales bacterium]|jgi:hypothetical protein|nr:hypothetical protein [Clostridiales bacterium]